MENIIKIIKVLVILAIIIAVLSVVIRLEEKEVETIQEPQITIPQTQDEGIDIQYKG